MDKFVESILENYYTIELMIPLQERDSMRELLGRCIMNLEMHLSDSPSPPGEDSPLIQYYKLRDEFRLKLQRALENEDSQ